MPKVKGGGGGGGGGGGRKPRSPNAVQSGREYAAQHRKSAGAAGHDSGSARLQALTKLLARKEKTDARASETMRCRIQVAETLLCERAWERALPLLTKSLELDPEDLLAARRLLVPLHLRLGNHEAAATLLSLWPKDESAAMTSSYVLLCLAAWSSGKGSEDATRLAFERAHRCNWHSTLLLAGWRTAAYLPEDLVACARTPTMDPPAPSGGIEEAIALNGRDLSGWAGAPDVESDQEDGDAGDEAVGEGGFPGLRGAAAWLAAALLGQPPPTSTEGVAGEGRRFVRLFEGEVLDAALKEVQERVVRAAGEDSGEEGEESGEEGEEEEEEEEEGEEEGEEDEMGEEQEEGQGEGRKEGSATEPRRQAQGRAAALEAWKAERRQVLQDKLLRAKQRAAVGGDGAVSSDDSSGDEEGMDESMSAAQPAGKRNRGAFEAWRAEKRDALKLKRARASARGRPNELSSDESASSDAEESNSGDSLSDDGMRVSSQLHQSETTRAKQRSSRALLNLGRIRPLAA